MGVLTLEDLEVAPTVVDYNNEYKVLRQIASGAFGSVHCVQRRDSKVIHAAKYVKSRGEDLLRELNALQSLKKCDFVLQFVAFYQSKSRVQSILVTEFLAGGDLCERTSAKNYVLTEEKCRNIIRQIIRGVQFIHSRRFIHLDIKRFIIVFSKKRDDYDLRIIDFGLARELGESPSVKIGMCGTIEYMSPEVMNCSEATPAADMWGVGCITFQLLSGGLSPFFAVSRFRTMAKVLDCDYSLDQAELSKTSPEAKDFISMLLIKEPKNRMTAEQCLQHSWLRDEAMYLGILQTLETSWMRRCLARRRWYRLFNAVRVMTRIANLNNCDSHEGKVNLTMGSSCEEEEMNGRHQALGDLPPFVRDISVYEQTFEKLHLIVNNGTLGTIFSVQKTIMPPPLEGKFGEIAAFETNGHVETSEVFSARHVKQMLDNLKMEAGILYQLRNVRYVIQLEGLYEGTRRSVLVTDFLCGGDLCERVSSSNFILNESKCKRFVRQICSGLEYVHKNNIVHLDLKPFSIIFTDPDEISDLKISDFNFAKHLELGMDGDPEPLKLKSMSGTVEFMSPEMVECSYATFSTDCWGVGIIAYMLITGGKSPFYGGSRFKTIAQILTCQYQLDIIELNHISPEAKSFIRELLLTDSKRRMTAVQCLEHPWLSSSDTRNDTLYTMETRWMKQLLARRRWHRWYNAVRAAQRIRKFSAASAVFKPING